MSLIEVVTKDSPKHQRVAACYAVSVGLQVSKYRHVVALRTAEEIGFMLGEGCFIILFNDSILYDSTYAYAGCIVEKDGDIDSLFNNTDISGMGAVIMRAAIKLNEERGVVSKGTCFDGFLTSYYKTAFGFEEAWRKPFDPEYAPDDWDYQKYGRPDVVGMTLKTLH